MSEWEGVLRLVIAAGIGGAIGFERGTLNKPAGVRTHMLVCMGAAMFMVISILLTHEYGGTSNSTRIDPTRIGSTIVTGIGFLGGAIIFRGNRGVRGLTTAAGVWVVAAIGMAVGAGYYITALGGGGIALIVLVIFRRVESMIELKQNLKERTFQIGSLKDD